MTNKTYRYTETFQSLQGEGKYTGANTLWLRLFNCNLACPGFGQADPTDPSTYEPVGADIDITNITSFSELPMMQFGCDSAYSVAKKYKDLAYNGTANEIVNKLESVLTNKYNTNGTFLHGTSKQEAHMAFTGGEPLLKFNQNAIIEVMHEFASRDNCPTMVTVETNGTQKLTKDFVEMLELHMTTSEYGGLIDDARGSTEWFWSVSPKLFSTSGESYRRAIKPAAVATYIAASDHGQLKFVVNGTDASWAEVEEAVAEFRAVGCKWDIYIMPVGGLKEDQESMQSRAICNEALARGYNVSSRLHCFIYGNALNT